MLEAYNCETVPQLLQELEEIYNDLCNIVTEAIVQGAEGISTRVSGCLLLLQMLPLNCFPPGKGKMFSLDSL